MQIPDFRAVFDALPGLILVVLPNDPFYTIVAANKAYLDVTEVGKQDILGRSVFEVFADNPDDAASRVDNLRRSFLQVIATGAQHTMPAEKYDVRRQEEQGGGLEERYWSPVNSPILGKNGEVAFIIHRVEDLTEPVGRADQLEAELFLRGRQLAESQRLLHERDSVEKKLLLMEARYSLAFAQAPIGMVLLTPEGQIIEVNQAYLDMLGYSREELSHRDTALITHPDDVSLTRAFFDGLRAGPHVTGSIEKRYFRKDGKMLWTKASATMRRDPQGRPTEVIAIVEDITDRVQAVAQIEEDRRRWRELLEQTPAGIAVLRGPEHRFEWVNSNYERLVSRSSALLLGNTVRDAFPEIDEQGYLELLNGVYTTGTPFIGREMPISLTQPAGSQQDFYLNFVYLPTRNSAGEIDGIFVHVTDITEMVIARKGIEESEMQFRTLAETIPHLAWMADDAGNRLWYNRRWYEYTGTTFETVKDRGWEQVHDPATFPAVLAHWQNALAAGDAFEMIDALKGPDGTVRSFLTRVEPLRNSTGKVTRWFGTHTDITDQRKTEETLRRMNRELEEFAYVASHDLQEPLRMVNIYTQLIVGDIEKENESLVRYAQFVQGGVRRMETLIQDLLTFSRTIQVEALPVGEADLSAAFVEATTVLKDRIADSCAVITTTPLPIVRGETSQFAHVFQNLISNAIKYKKPDRPLQIHISAECTAEHRTVTISDNGIGFDPRYSEVIFGLFKRLHKDEYAGTGLGLAICKRIIERYGGHIWAECNPGEGATFRFSLPNPGSLGNEAG